MHSYRRFYAGTVRHYDYRITSYNVCYTKLLRVCVDEDPIRAVKNNISIASMVHVKDFYIRPADCNPGEGWFPSAAGRYLRGAIAGQGDLDIPARITSYNVCYTKLLRVCVD